MNAFTKSLCSTYSISDWNSSCPYNRIVHTFNTYGSHIFDTVVTLVQFLYPTHNE
jgi:hypothetical protein